MSSSGLNYDRRRDGARGWVEGLEDRVFLAAHGQEGAHAKLLGSAIDRLHSTHHASHAVHANVAAKTVHPDTTPTAQVSVSGKALWTDAAGATHPIPLAEVDIRSTIQATTDAPLATLRTDALGNFSGSFSFDPSAGAITIFARIIASNVAAAVKPDTGAAAQVYSMDSARVKVTGPASVTFPDRVAGTKVAAEKSFGILAAILEAATYAGTLAGSADNMPSQLDVRFPSNTAVNGPASFFDPTARQLIITRRRAFDWDVIQHEYGHFVMDRAGFAATIEGEHDFFISNPKPNGPGLAWNEGWATFFAISCQRANAVYAQNVPEVGNASFDPTGSPSVDLARQSGRGELDEFSVASSLYHLEIGDQGIQIADTALYQDFAAAKATTFGAAYEAIAASLSGEQRGLLGHVLGLQEIAPVETGPSDSATVTASTPPTFTWRPGSSNDFVIQFYSSDFKTLLDQTADLGNVTTFTPSAAEWATIFDGHFTVKWVVEGQNTSSPATPGAIADQTYSGTTLNRYWSSAGTINGPSIVLVIDATTTMIPALTAFYTALRQFQTAIGMSVPPLSPPTVEILSALGSTVTDVMSSNDLNQVVTAFHGVLAGIDTVGGGASADTLSSALGNAADDVSSGGTVILAGDSALDPGVDLSQTLWTLSSKGAVLDATISGNGAGVVEPTPVGTLSSAAVARGADFVKVAGFRAVAQPNSSFDGPEVNQGPIADAGQSPIADQGATTSTATPLAVNGEAVEGTIGVQVQAPSGALIANNSELFAVTLQAGAAYNFWATARGQSNFTLTLLAPDGVTALGSATSAVGSSGLSGATLAFTPSAGGTYYLSVARPDSPTSFAVGASDTLPIGDTSPLAAYSTLAASTGGQFTFDDAIATSTDPNVATAYQSTILNELNSAAAPTVLAASPADVPAGATAEITLTGRGTHWLAGQTTVVFSGAPVNVQSVNVLTPTQLVATVVVSPTATAGFAAVTVMATQVVGSAAPGNVQTALGADALQITASPSGPAITFVGTGTLLPGQTTTLDVGGVNTAWNANSVLSLGPGVDVLSTSVVSSTKLTATVSVSATATIGFRQATVTTGAHVDTLDRAVLLEYAPPVISLPSSLEVTAGLLQQFDITPQASGANVGPWTVDVNWGDGAADTVFTASAASAQPGSMAIPVQHHVYATAGVDRLTVTATNANDSALVGTATSTVTVSAVNALILTAAKGTALAVGGHGKLDVTGVGEVSVNSASHAAVALSGDASASAYGFNIVGQARGRAPGGIVQAHQPPADVPLGQLGRPSTTSAVINHYRAPGPGAFTLQPGTYTGGLVVGGTSKVTLSPGVYIIHGGLTVASRATLAAAGALIYIASGSLKIAGIARLSPLADASPFSGIAIEQNPVDRAAMIVTGTLSLGGIVDASSAPLQVQRAGDFSQTMDPTTGAGPDSVFSSIAVGGFGQVTLAQPLTA